MSVHRALKDLTCSLCRTNEPRWIVHDDKVRRMHFVQWGQDKVRTERFPESYLVCNTCKHQVRRYAGRRKIQISAYLDQADLDEAAPSD